MEQTPDEITIDPAAQYDGLVAQVMVQVVVTITKTIDGRTRVVGTVPIEHQMTGEEYDEWEPSYDDDVASAVTRWKETNKPDKKTRQLDRNAARKGGLKSVPRAKPRPKAKP